MRASGRMLALVIALGAPAVEAAPWGYTPLDVELGPGLLAHRDSFFGRGRRFRWRLTGLGEPPNGAWVEMYAAGPGGRVFAATERGVIFSDDRGRSWRDAWWDGNQHPRSLTFDADTGLGVAVGTNGAVWSSHDRGEHWQVEREGGETLVDVAAFAQTVVWVGARGLVQVSGDLGHTAQTLPAPTRAPLPALTPGLDVAWVAIDGDQWWRVRPGPVVDRVDPPRR